MKASRLIVPAIAILTAFAVLGVACNGDDGSGATPTAGATTPAATSAPATEGPSGPTATTAAGEPTSAPTDVPPTSPPAEEPTEAPPEATATEAPEEPTVAPPPASQTLNIGMVASQQFTTDELTASAGATITVAFDNQETGIPHNWALYADEDHTQGIAGVNDNICSGPCTGEVTFGPLEPGEYYYICNVHPGLMQGELQVQ